MGFVPKFLTSINVILTLKLKIILEQNPSCGRKLTQLNFTSFLITLLASYPDHD
jgi:hypothetical protein